MMEFASTLNNPLLQVAVSLNEPVLHRACDFEETLKIAAGMRQFPDGRDSIIVVLHSVRGSVSFEMVLRNFFDRAVLARVAARAWGMRAEPVRPAARATYHDEQELVAALQN